MKAVEEIKKELEKKLSERRYEHSIGVMKMAGELAKIYGVDVETAQILEMMTGRKQKADSYKLAGYYATQLLQHSDLAKVIRISQFSGDDSWIQYIGEEQSKLLAEKFDVLVNALYVSYSDIDTPEKRESLHNKMGLAQDAIEDFIDNYCSKKDVDAFTQSLEIADKRTIEMTQQKVSIKPITEEISSPIKI